MLIWLAGTKIIGNLKLLDGVMTSMMFWMSNLFKMTESSSEVETNEVNSVWEVFKQNVGYSIPLREEQKVAINCLLDGRDVLAVLLTG